MEDENDSPTIPNENDSPTIQKVGSKRKRTDENAVIDTFMFIIDVFKGIIKEKTVQKSESIEKIVQNSKKLPSTASSTKYYCKTKKK